MSNLRILVVDDEPILAELLKRFMLDISSDVLVAHSFSAAMEFLRIQPPPDLITLDLAMHDSGAEHTISKIHEIRAANEASVIIVLSGAVDTRDSERILAAGADAFWLKESMLPMRGAGKGFFSNILDAIAALVKQPVRFEKNVRILELLAERVSRVRTRNDPAGP